MACAFGKVIPIFAFVLAACGSGSDVTFGPDPGPKQLNDTPPEKHGSCVNHCGATTLDHSCFCDQQCLVAGDCCADFSSACSAPDAGVDATGLGGMPAIDAGKPPASGGIGGTSGSGGGIFDAAAPIPDAGGSCAGYCGDSPNGTCWCDDLCQGYGDCCSDFVGACLGGGTGTGCSATLCNTATPGFENSAECYCDSLCDGYGDCCSNKPNVCPNY